MSLERSPAKYLIFSAFLILVDQATKLLVHHYMTPGFAGQITLIEDWLKLHYVLNPGMAFGMQLGHENGKLFLTLFRLVAMVGIGYYLVHMVRRGASTGFLWAMSMIFGGAVGNVIDSTFYGVFLEGNVTYGSTTPWFHGQVIDMIFVDFWEGFIPEWVPVWGGQYYSTPIFNVADSCIFIGVCIILVFQGHFFTPTEAEVVEEEASGEPKEGDSASTETVAAAYVEDVASERSIEDSEEVLVADPVAAVPEEEVIVAEDHDVPAGIEGESTSGDPEIRDNPAKERGQEDKEA
jgi:signal peptidase II